MTAVPPTEPPSRERVEARRSYSLSDVPMTAVERGIARIPLFDLPGVRQLVDSVYLDTFYRTIESEFTRFSALPVSPAELRPIKGRVAASIRTIAAFSAWYAVGWKIVALGFRAGFVAGALIAALLVAGLRPSGGVTLILGAAIPLVTLLACARAALAIPRRWPAGALVLVVAAVVCATAAELLFWPARGTWWGLGALAAASGAAVAFAIALLGLVLAQLLSQRVTLQKIRGFPEEEIIQTIAYALTSFVALGDEWRFPEERARLVETLEWIARRFERDLVRPYLGTDPASDADLRATARACAAAFRAHKLELAFPTTATRDRLGDFLWDALTKTALSDWDSLARPTPAVGTKPSRILARIREAAGFALPALLAAVVAALPPGVLEETLRRNAVITLLSWSLLSVLAAINPRRFETQADAAKTLGELVGRS